MIELKFKKNLISANGDLLLDIDCKINKNELTTIFGKSGAGKTTILKILAGLLTPEVGLIKVEDEIWLDTQKNINLKPQNRQIGFVFQDYALFPNMSIRENLAFAIPKQTSKIQAKEQIDEILEITELTNLQKLKPNMLSGGQQQRVALARAVIRKPKILLLDEPFSALDIEMNVKLREELLKIHRHFSLSTFLVSHNFSEVFSLSSHVLHMQNGKVIKSGTANEVFLRGIPSGKVRQSGNVLNITENGIFCIVSILTGNDIIKLSITKNEAKELKIGDLVIISTKAFNPTITKLTKNIQYF
ncbi:MULTISPECIES: sulfate/molybdate ABC transporter ATP-binding protein [Helicobacter]|uniref:ATP-binding cassette domain-containing protein n=1 Tax=Helicobacter ibis TaxID=2962633 RepID=A0ABT4VER0_9HELI|nr:MULTISPECIES: ATP-binding cassette domain-containing protein [Helicobacter]MDA3967054.1 ATP-binding cassette domain-containing protein [Helicobacter sp. WB40]MDA3969188.1 ATP-binding cassette domain-containing protein [Helicobacter ibis]